MKKQNQTGVTAIINPQSIFTIQELAGYLKIPVSTLYKLVQEGTIPSQKIGRQWRFHKDAVDDWLKNIPSSRRLKG